MHGQFQIHSGLQSIAQQNNIAFLDVAAIFSQMNCYAIGSRKFCLKRGLHGIRVPCSPRLPQSRHMIDIDPQRYLMITAPDTVVHDKLSRIHTIVRT